MKFQISKVFDFFIEKWEFETVFEDTDGSFAERRSLYRLRWSFLEWKLPGMLLK